MNLTDICLTVWINISLVLKQTNVCSSEHSDKNCVQKQHETSRVYGRLDSRGMISLGRNWCRWEENIIFYLKEVGRNGEDGINLAMHWDEWHAVL